MFNNIRSIILMQIMVAAACWFTMWLWNPFSKPIAERLDALPEHTHQHLVEQMKLYTSTQQLPQKEEQKMLSINLVTSRKKSLETGLNSDEVI